MTTLWFENRYGGFRKVAELAQDGDDALDPVCDKIDEFLRNHDYKSYYTRLWNTKVEIGGEEFNATQFDVGSYDEFFYAIPPVWLTEENDNAD